MDLYDILLQKQVNGGGGGGSEPVIEPLSVTDNGEYSAPSGVNGYSPVTVNVGGGDHDAEDALVTGTISTYTNNRVTKIGDCAFYRHSSLRTVNFPNVTSIGASAFQACSKLTTADFPNATKIGSSAFQQCSSLTTANIPNATSICSYAFYGCSSLATASFPNATRIEMYAFCSCTKLMSLYFLGSSVPALGGNASVFAGTPMSNSTYTGSFGSIYVPASLVDSYKTATYWSRYSERITAYEG